MNLKLDSFKKNILSVMIGVFISQLILFISSIYLTQIFSPKEFGLVAFFISIVNILTIISTFRYDQSIVMSKNKNSAYDIYLITNIIVLLFSIFLFLIIIIFKNFISELINKPEINYWIYFIPLLVIFNGFFQASKSLLIREKKFNFYSISMIIKSISLSILLVSLGLSYKALVIFLISNIIAQFLQTLYVISKINHLVFGLKNALLLLKENYLFPKYLLPSDFISNYNSQNPIFLFSFFYNDSIVGFFSLTRRIFSFPIRIITNSVSEVYKQEASEAFNHNGNCKNEFLKTFKLLFIIGFLPTILVIIIAPDLFIFFLGEKWSLSGTIARYLSIMYFFQFTISPLSYTIIIANRQNLNLYWQISLLLITTFSIIVGFYYFDSFHYSILGYSLSYSCMYVIYFFILFKSSKGNNG